MRGPASASALGLRPIADEETTAAGALQRFAHGTLTWDRASNEVGHLSDQSDQSDQMFAVGVRGGARARRVLFCATCRE